MTNQFCLCQQKLCVLRKYLFNIVVFSVDYIATNDNETTNNYPRPSDLQLSMIFYNFFWFQLIFDFRRKQTFKFKSFSIYHLNIKEKRLTFSKAKMFDMYIGLL